MYLATSCVYRLMRAKHELVIIIVNCVFMWDLLEETILKMLELWLHNIYCYCCVVVMPNVKHLSKMYSSSKPKMALTQKWGKNTEQLQNIARKHRACEKFFQSNQITIEFNGDLPFWPFRESPAIELKICGHFFYLQVGFISFYFCRKLKSFAKS